MNSQSEAIAEASRAESRGDAGVIAALRRFDPNSASHVTRAILFTVLVVLAGALTYRYVGYVNNLLHYPYEWDEDEGFPIYFAQRLLAREPIYVDFNKLPMVSSHYPPVFPAAVALFVPRFGATLLAGRLVSIASVIGICILLIAVLRQETGRWSLGILAAVLVLGSPYFAALSPLCRHDSLAVFLVLTGFLLVRQYPRSRAALPLGLVLLILACYTKQQVVLVMPAAFWHLWRQSQRVAWISFGAFALAGIAMLVWLSHWSDGHFWRSTVSVHAADYLLGFLSQRIREFTDQHTILVAGTLGLLAYQISRRSLDIWGAFAISSTLLVLLTGKRGAGLNYFLPLLVATAICTTIAMDRVTRGVPLTWASGTSAGVMLVVSLQLFVFCVLYSIYQPTTADRQAGDKIVGVIRRTKGDILTDRRIMFSLLTGRQPQIDACTMMMAYQIGREPPPGTDGIVGTAWDPKPGATVLWDPSELINAIREKRYPLIVLGPEFFTQDVSNAVSANYRRLEPDRVTMGNYHGSNRYYLMRPR